MAGNYLHDYIFRPGNRISITEDSFVFLKQYQVRLAHYMIDHKEIT